MTTVIFPDVELWAVGYLRAQLDDTSLFISNKDEGAPEKTSRIIVRRDGGPQTSRVTESARLGVRVLASTEQAATDLARLVWAHLGAAPGNGPVRGFTGLSGPTAIADPAGPLRYMTCQFTVRGAAL